MFKNIALLIMCKFHCSNDHNMFNVVDNAAVHYIIAKFTAAVLL